MELSVTTVSNISALILMVASTFMVLLVINFYRLRNLKEIASRRPGSSFIAGILCTGANMVVLPGALFYLNNIDAPYIPWLGTFIHLGMMLTIIAPYHIFTFRAWMVYFDIKFNQSLDAQQWRLYIDPEETNWFLKRRHTWGNQKRVALFMFIHWAIFTFLVVILVALNGHRGSPLSRVCIGLGGIDPMLLDIYLYFKFPKFNDIWGINTEIIWTLRAELLQQFLYYLLVLVFKMKYYTMLYTATLVMAGSTTFLFVLVIHWRVFRIFQLPSVPCVQVQWTKDREHMNNLTNEQSMDPSTRERCRSGSEFSDSATVKINLGHVLEDKHGFNEFARQLTREFCVENILFFVETHQWKKSLANKERYSSFETSALMEITLPENAPKSKIIQSDGGPAPAPKGSGTEVESELPSDEEYLEALRLFKKYITNSAYFVLNISSSYRRALYKAFMFDDRAHPQRSEEEWVQQLRESKTMDRKTLFHIFNETRAEIWYLLLYSFVRFKETETFTKVVQTMTVSAL